MITNLFAHITPVEVPAGLFLFAAGMVLGVLLTLAARAVRLR